MRILRIALWLLAALAIVCSAVVFGLYVYRPGLLPYEQHLAPVDGAASGPRREAGPLVATWLGTTAVLLSDGQSALLIDPFFSRPPGIGNLMLNRRISPDERRIAGGLKLAGVLTLDGVLVSHTHYDHAMDAGLVAQLTSAPLVGSASAANIGRGAGLPAEQIITIRPNEPIRCGAFTVTFIPSRHAGATGGRPTGEITEPLKPPARYLDYKEGGSYSILIEHPRGTLLHHGSAGFVPGALKAAMKVRKADVVFLGVALVDDLDTYLREVVDAVGARRVIPTHWDDFTQPLDEPLTPMPVVVRLERFFIQMKAKRPDLMVQTLKAWQPVTLFQ